MKKITLTSILFILLLTLVCDSITAQAYNDCSTAFPVCKINSYHIKSMDGFGSVNEKPTNLSCIPDNFDETNSYWMKWKIEKPGILTFVIDPNMVQDDIDFVLFKQKENGSCNNLEAVRCMATGKALEKTDNENAPCIGSTGLKLGSLDEFERQGCKFNSDNYLKYLDTKQDEEYILLINNYNSKEGFSITFEGSAVLASYEDCPTNSITGGATITKVYPNPSKSEIFIEINSNTVDNIDIDIIDFNGKIQERLHISVEKGTNTINMDIKKYPAGTYLARLIQGQYVTTKMFSKVN